MTNLENDNFPPLLGYVLHNPDKDSFFHSRLINGGHSMHLFVANPCSATIFETEQSAFNLSRFIDIPLEVLPLYDNGLTVLVSFIRTTTGAH